MDTEEITNFWDKKIEDLNVKDIVVMNCVLLAVLAGGIVAIGVAENVKDKIVNKFRKNLVVVPVDINEAN